MDKIREFTINTNIEFKSFNNVRITKQSINNNSSINGDKTQVKNYNVPSNVINIDEFENKISKLTNTRLTKNNNITLLIDGDKAYKNLHEIIDSAKETINMSYYIFADDEASWELAEKLANKARNGVKVNLLIDGIGSGNYSKVILNYLKSAGVNLVIFNDIAPDKIKDLRRIDFRDHSKITVVDGKVALTGGMNIANEYKDSWHDMMIKLEGDVVADIQQTFIKNFERSGGKISDKTKLFPSISKEVGNIPSRVICTDEEKKDIKKTVYQAIDSAKKHIYVETPYFGEREFIDKLIAASKRGVKVKLILPEKSDVKFADLSAQKYYDELLKAGIEVYLYTKKTLHSKAISVDGVWGSVGSANLSARAFNREREMNVTFSCPLKVAELDKELFEKDIKESKKLDRYKPTFINKIVNLFDPFI